MWESKKDLHGCHTCPYVYIQDGDQSGDLFYWGENHTYSGFDFPDVPGITAAEISIHGSLDDHFFQNPGGYPYTGDHYNVYVKLNGVDVTTTCPFEHGTPFRGPFENTVTWTIPVDPSLVKTSNEVYIELGPPEEEQNWIILDWVAITISKQTTDGLIDDTYPPTGAVHAHDNLIWPANNKMVEVTLDGYVLDELSIARDGSGIGVSSAYLLVDGNKYVLRDGITDLLDENGRFNITVEVKAVKGAVYDAELYATDTEPEDAGGPNSGLVDSTHIRVPHDMSVGKSGK